MVKAYNDITVSDLTEVLKGTKSLLLFVIVIESFKLNHAS